MNTIKIITDEVSIVGEFKGTITVVDPEYDFGGFLKIWNKDLSIEEQYNQICAYFFPSFMEKGKYREDINYKNNEKLALKLSKKYHLFLRKIGIPSPKDLETELIDDWPYALFGTDDMLSMVIGAIRDCLTSKDIFLLYSVFIDDIEYQGLVENKFFKTIKIG